MSTLEELVAVLQDAGSDPSRLATAAENLHKQIDALVERRVRYLFSFEASFFSVLTFF